MGGHHERAVGAEHRFQGEDYGHRATADPAHFAEGGVNQWRHPSAHNQVTQIIRQAVDGDRGSGGLDDVVFGHTSAETRLLTEVQGDNLLLIANVKDRPDECGSGPGPGVEYLRSGLDLQAVGHRLRQCQRAIVVEE